jgi:Flp pilus assembly protein TadD
LTAANRLSEAIERFREALGVRPDFAEAHNNLGVALAHLSRSAEALEHFRQAVRLQPEFDQARANLRAAEEAGGDRP